MAHNFSTLQSYTRDQVIEEYNRLAEHTVLGLNFWRDEILRRDIEAQNDRALSLTRAVAWMTALILVLTIVNVAVMVMMFLTT